MPIPAGMDAWLSLALEMSDSVWAKPAEQWIEDRPTTTDIEMLDRETKGDSTIDKQNLRSEMMARWRSKTDGVDVFVRELPGRTRVVVVGTLESFNKIPWAFWARLFQAIGHPVGYVLIYAHEMERVFPSAGEPIDAQHVNGGYSYLCKQSLVVVYRIEEITRVLLHELLHTACFDSEKETVELEANTEAWTELFLCALLSRGSQQKFMRLWGTQCQWIAAQAGILKARHGVEDEDDYAWRYMTGKLRVLEDHGFFMPSKRASKVPLSLRMTTPEWDAEML
jgi:hypothetical protein